MSVPFPGSPDDMMNTIAELRARNAALEGVIKTQNGVLNEERARVAKLEAGIRTDWNKVAATAMEEREVGQEKGVDGPVMSTLVQWRGLRARVAELEGVIQTQNGVVVSGTLKLNEARARVAKLERALERCKTVLGNMALENEGAVFNRWPISHEPLRNDARNLLPIIDAALSETVEA